MHREVEPTLPNIPMFWHIAEPFGAGGWVERNEGRGGEGLHKR